jgi:preprotein translocase subunit YajC
MLIFLAWIHDKSTQQFASYLGDFILIFLISMIVKGKMEDMNRRLKPGDRVRTVDGAIVEIQSIRPDGLWIRVRYIESDEDPSMVGTQTLCHINELQERIGK